MSKKIISYGRHFVDEDDINQVIKTLESDFLTQGPVVEEFEIEFAKYIGSKYAIAVSNGTAALHLSAIALSVKKGSKVITTPNSFLATSNCIEYCEGEVEFCDIDPNSFCIDIDKLKKILQNSPKKTYQGIIPVNFGGFPVNMELLRELANEYGLWILEDSCHSPGGYFFDKKGKKQNCGNGYFSDLSIFSFHPVKHITTGEGGMITTNSKRLYNKIQSLKSHGIIRDKKKIECEGSWFYEMKSLGFNYRIPDILCALGISQLKKAPKYLKKRKQIANRYHQAFLPYSDEIKMQEFSKGHAYHLFVINVIKRKELYEFLRERKINCQIHYIPIYKQPYYIAKYGKQFLENMENYYKTCLSLPIYPSLSDEEQFFVINSIKEFYE